MKDRIRLLRKELQLTQQEFSAQLGTEQNTISSYEIGRTKPSSAMLNNICKTFSVNEQWLRTGEGEMFVKKSADDEISSFINQLLQQDPDNIRYRFISALARLNEEDLRTVEQFVRFLIASHEADEGEPQVKKIG